MHAICVCVCFMDMAISRDRCPWTRVCANRYLLLTDRPSTGNYTERSTAGGTELSRIYINLHVSLGLAAASGTLYEPHSHSADNLFNSRKCQCFPWNPYINGEGTELLVPTDFTFYFSLKAHTHAASQSTHFWNKSVLLFWKRLLTGNAVFGDLKWNSHQKATKALFVFEYESNLCVNA